VMLPADFPEWRRHLLSDPQTSGGLLLACAPARAADLLSNVVAAGYPGARVIGHAGAGTPGITAAGGR
jgi:selenide, water dikinase